jgi:hypothetical protein
MLKFPKPRWSKFKQSRWSKFLKPTRSKFPKPIRSKFPHLKKIGFAKQTVFCNGFLSVYADRTLPTLSLLRRQYSQFPKPIRSKFEVSLLFKFPKLRRFKIETSDKIPKPSPILRNLMFLISVIMFYLFLKTKETVI